MKELDLLYEEFTNYLKSTTTTSTTSNTKSTGGDKQKNAGSSEGKYNAIVAERLAGYIQTIYKYIKACLVP